MPSFPTVKGADLYTDADASLIGPDNYVVAENTRYEDGYETLLKGWHQYDGKTGAGEVTLIHHAENAAGDFEQLIGQPDRIRRRGDNNDWVTVGSGFTASGKRWQAATLNGVTVVSNGHDCPRAKRVHVGSFTPIHELREIGVVSVGCLWVWGGTLFMGDITELREDKKVEWFNTANDPYRDRPGEEFLTRTPFMVLWSTDALRWRRILHGSINGKVVTLEHGVRSLKVGDKVSFVEAGDQPPATQDDIETTIISEATVMKIGPFGKTITLDEASPSPASGYFYSKDYFEQIVGFDELTGDGRILAMRGLREQMVILMDRAFILVTASGNAVAPFLFDPLKTADSGEEGSYVQYPHTVVSVGEEWLLYRGRYDWWRFDLSTRLPRRIHKLALVDNLFKDVGVNATESFFAADHGEEEQVWIGMPGRDSTVIYDYAHDRVRTVDHGWTALGAVKSLGYGHPGNRRGWIWLMAEEASHDISIWGYQGDAELYTRRGKPYEGRLVYGLVGSQQQSTRVTRYEPMIATGSPVHPLKVGITSRDIANGEERVIVEKALEDVATRGVIRLIAKASWFQDTLTFSGPLRISGRTWDYAKHTNRVRGWG